MLKREGFVNCEGMLPSGCGSRWICCLALNYHYLLGRRQCPNFLTNQTFFFAFVIGGFRDDFVGEDL